MYEVFRDRHSAYTARTHRWEVGFFVCLVFCLPVLFLVLFCFPWNSWRQVKEAQSVLLASILDSLDPQVRVELLRQYTAYFPWLSSWLFLATWWQAAFLSVTVKRSDYGILLLQRQAVLVTQHSLLWLWLLHLLLSIICIYYYITYMYTTNSIEFIIVKCGCIVNICLLVQ